MNVDSFGESDAAEGRRIKIWFRFVPREGWLPYDQEGLWAVQVGDDTARIESVPFLQNGVAQGDVVRFVSDGEGLRWAVGQVEASGGCTIRVLPVPSGPLGPSATAVHERFAPFGVGGEAFSDDFPLVAFDVRADMDMSGIKALLVQGEADGWWHYEEGCVNDAWRDA